MTQTATKTATRTATRTADALVLTVDATKSVAPHRIRSMVKAMRPAEGQTIRVEIFGRDSGPRVDRARAIAARAITAFGGVPA